MREPPDHGALLLQAVQHLAYATAANLRRSEEIKINQGRILAELYRQRGGTNVQDYEFQVFSQWGEDGILQYLVREVPLANRTFIEFGVEDFAESNCRFLMMKDNWQGLVLDSSERNIAAIRDSYYFWKYDLQAVQAFVTAENIDALLAAAGFDADLGVLSVDIDGMDFWVLQAVRCVRPRILITEYNALFGPDRIVTVPYQADFERLRRHPSGLFYGASLGAMTALAISRGYDLVGTNSNGTNAFFVRSDVRPAGLPALTVQEAFTPCRVREMRDAAGRLTYADRQTQLAAIRGLPVVNLVTGEIEPL